MGKRMAYSCKSLCNPLQMNKQFIIKLGFSVLFLGLGFRLLCNKSSVSDAPFLENSQISKPLIVSRENTDQTLPKENSTETIDREEKCNIYLGEWIPSKSGPSYTNKSCSFIEDHQNCIKNGRSDMDYLYWRWKPHGCELPRFDPNRFLQLMRNKSWAFIGDSISRNHVQSLLCMLSTVEEAIQVYHSSDYRSRRWIFPSYNFTVSVIWSPFLAKAAINEDNNGVSTSDIELNLDVLDQKWTEVFKNTDYVILSGGKWFVRTVIYYENNTILGCHYCKRNLTDIGFDVAYRKVINRVFDYFISSNHKGMIFYRTTTPVHFENGEWYEGGTCNRTRPAKEGEPQQNILVKILREVELTEFEKVSARAREHGINLNLFDVNPLSLLRPDGHPGPYRFFQPFAKDKDAKVISDCLHWCLPGPIDSWNDLLMQMVVNGLLN